MPKTVIEVSTLQLRHGLTGLQGLTGANAASVSWTKGPWMVHVSLVEDELKAAVSMPPSKSITLEVKDLFGIYVMDHHELVIREKEHEE